MAISTDTEKWDYGSTGKPGVLGLSTGNPGVQRRECNVDCATLKIRPCIECELSKRVIVRNRGSFVECPSSAPQGKPTIGSHYPRFRSDSTRNTAYFSIGIKMAPTSARAGNGLAV